MIISSKLPIGDKRKVLILGNGFDLDLGRKTLYKDFYESDYCPKDYPAPLIHHLNKKWVIIWKLLSGMIWRTNYIITIILLKIKILRLTYIMLMKNFI